MMTKLELSPEELAYLSGLLNLRADWGIQPQFEQEDTAVLENQILRLQTELVSRSCLISQVDGYFTVEPQCRELLTGCVNCSQAYVLHSENADGLETRCYFFCDGSRLIRYYRYRDEQHLRGNNEFSFYSTQLMDAEIRNCFDKKETADLDCSLITSVNVLRKIGSLTRNRFLNELNVLGCSADMAERIAEALQGKNSFSSLLKLDVQKDRYTVCGKLMVLHCSRGGLMVTNVEGDPESVCLTAADTAQIDRKLKELLGTAEEADVV